MKGKLDTSDRDYNGDNREAFQAYLVQLTPICNYVISARPRRL